MKHITNIHKKNTKGFTLIEMLVSVGLFSVVMLVAVAAILSIIGNNKKAQGINNVANNLNFAVESMVRDMKTGFLYKCPSSNGNYSSGWPISKATLSDVLTDLCTGTGAHEAVAFFSTLDGGANPIEYKFIPPSGQVGTTNYVPGYIVKRSGTSPSAPSVELTSKTDVDIQSMKMYVTSPAPGTHAQPGIFLIITGKAHILDNQVTDFGLQTFISQRILNL